jgi:hypothetical protein
MMRYDEGRRVIHLRKEMGFEMCGQRVDAKTDVCVMERSGTGAKYLLLVQEDKVRRPYLSVAKIYLPVTRTKRHLSRDDPEPQLSTKTTELAKQLDYQSSHLEHLRVLL